MRPVRPTSIVGVVVSGLVVGLMSYVLLERFYNDLPSLPVVAGPVMLMLAVFEAAAAWTTRARIQHRPGMRPVQPLMVARLVALAKASAIGGAILFGVWAGALTYTVRYHNRLVAAGHDLLPAALATGAAVLLVASALWLEYACRTPKPPPEDLDTEQDLGLEP